MPVSHDEPQMEQVQQKPKKPKESPVGSPVSKKEKPAKPSSSPRDFSVFFDDEPDEMDDFFNFSRSVKKESTEWEPLRRPKPSAKEDIPPWEELPQPDISEIATEYGDDMKPFSDATDVPPWDEQAVPSVSEIIPEYVSNDRHSELPERETKTLPEKKENTYRSDAGSADDDDDDLFDDVMSSPWIKKL